MIIDVYRASLSETLKLKGTKILTADVAVSTRRLLTDDEITMLQAAMPTGARFSAMTEMFAMVSTANESRLAMLRFIDDAFPLVGDLQIQKAEDVVNSAGRNLGSKQDEVWVAPDLLALMDAAVGDEVRIGRLRLKIGGLIAKDSSQTFRMGSMAPRIYIHRKHLQDSGLLQFGSTFSDTRYAAVPEAVTNLKGRVEHIYPDPAIQVTVPTDLEQGSLRVLSRLLDYLGLVGLVTLAIGWIGVYYLGRRWLMLEQNAGGLLKCLGFTSGEIQRLWLGKLTLILTTGVALGGFLAWLLAHAAAPMFRSGLPDDFQLYWSWRNTVLLALIGPGTGWLLLSDAIERAAATPPLQLIGGQTAPPRTQLYWLYLPAGVAILAVALTFLQARSWIVTAAFLGSLVGSVLMLVAFAAVGLVAVKKLRHRSSGWLWHTSSSLWLRRPVIAVLMVTVSALTGLLSQLIPHLEKTLIGELQAPASVERPGLFLFDVQDEQKESLKNLLREHSIQISETSPFIRGRILQINGTDFERADVKTWSTREEEVDARMRNRGINLTFREHLGPAEKIIAGKDFAAMSTDEISVEQGYAERLKLKIGDSVKFDVQGVNVIARIANLREVNWDSFQPNFFMEFKSGVIDEAPKTWIFTVRKSAEWPAPRVQRLIAKEYPNVTSINVDETISSLSDLLQQLAKGLKIASRLSLALGLFVFIMILMFQLLSSERDWIQLHRQGLTGSDLRKLQFATFGTLSLAGSALGSGLSLLVGWVIARWAFTTAPRFDFAGLFSIFALTLGLSALALWLLSRGQFKRTQFKSRFDGL